MVRAEDVLAKISNDIVIEIMDENGSPLYGRSKDGRTGQECLWFKTICHGGDSHKLCYFTETKDFYCYTNCGRIKFFDFIKKIRGFKDDDFYRCLLYLSTKAGINLKRERIGLADSHSVRSVRSEIEDADWKFELDIIRPEVKINKYYDPAILNYFDEKTFYQGWVDEGISIETMAKYQIKWYEYQKHIIIPHFDINGNLVGIRRRSLKPEDARNKYMPEFIEGRAYEHSLGLNLYGLYQNQAAIRRQRAAIIVEGEKSVLLSDSYYGDKSIAVATCGFNVSEIQLQYLEDIGVDTIYLGFDKDFDVNKESEYAKDKATWDNYQHYITRLNALAQRVATKDHFKVYLLKDKEGLLGPKDSPFDKGKQTFEKIRKNRICINSDD
jgi:hypothetical protein